MKTEPGTFGGPPRRGSLELGAHQRPTGQAQTSRPAPYRFGGTWRYGQVEVYAAVCPERVEPEIGNEVDHRDAQGRAALTAPISAAAELTQYLSCHGVGRNHNVGVGFPHPLKGPSSGEHGEEPSHRSQQEREPEPHSERQFVGPRSMLELGFVTFAQCFPDPKWGSLQEITDFGLVTRFNQAAC